MDIPVLPWANECTLTPYPFTQSFGYDSFLIDASFVQFDNFVPTLNTITTGITDITLTFTFDKLTKMISVAIADCSTFGFALRIYDNTRYLGVVTFGYGVTKLLNNNSTGEIVIVNQKFLAHTVKSIPSNCGVFTIDSKYGALTFTHDQNVYYVVTGQNIEFNAIGYPDLSDELYLKTLNSVGPTHNSVYVDNTSVIKIKSANATVEVSLIGTDTTDLTRPTSIIVTSDNNA